MCGVAKPLYEIPPPENFPTRCYAMRYDAPPVNWRAPCGRRRYPPHGNACDLLRRLFATLPGRPFLEGPIGLYAEFAVQLPRSYSAKRRAALAGNVCSRRPDLTNYIKFIEDVLTGIWYGNDALVCQQSSRKIWAESPYTIVMAYEVEKAPKAPEIYSPPFAFGALAAPSLSPEWKVPC